MSAIHLLVEVFRRGISADLENGRHVDFSDWEIELTNKLLIDLRLLERVEFYLSSTSLGYEKDDDVTEQAAAFYAKEIAELAVDFVEYGIKLLAGAVMVLSAGLFVVLVALLPIVVAVFLVACCPVAALAVASIVAVAVGLGWLRKKVQSEKET